MKRFDFYCIAKDSYSKYENDIFIGINIARYWYLSEHTNQRTCLNPSHYINFPFHDKIKFDENLKIYYANLENNEIMYLKLMS